MPEGPEIHLAADMVGEAIAGAVAQQLFFAFDALKPYQAKLSGRIVAGVRARGKAMLIGFDNGLTIFSHNQLYGQWVVRDALDFPETNRQLRLAIHTDRKSALLYSASDIAVLRDDELKDHPYLKRLGPDVLDPTVTTAQVLGQFHRPGFQRRRLSGLLLDQQFLAGLGNYLRSEILFVARVAPTLRPADCSPEQLRRLAEAALALARQSYRTRGITNSPELAEALRRQGVSRSEYRFWVFNRQAEPCRVCATPIQKETLGGRRLYYCPSCQTFTQI
ncbi:MAG: endonuclease VIII [Anaerolineae bacterium]